MDVISDEGRKRDYEEDDSDCVDAGKRAKLYEIGDEDFISQLPDVMISSVFKHVHYDDLVQICGASRKMHHLGTQALIENQNKECKTRLTIKQKKDGVFCVNTWSMSDDEFYLTTRSVQQGPRFFRPKIEKGKGPLPQDVVEQRPWRPAEGTTRTLITHEIYNAVQYLLCRFQFEEIRFENVLIDDNFLVKIRPALKSQNVYISQPCLENASGVLTYEGLIDMLLPLKARSLILQQLPVSINGEDYEYILNKIATTSPNMTIQISADRVTTVECVMNAPRKAVISALSTIRCVHLDGLVISEKAFKDVVRRRIASKRQGYLIILLPRAHFFEDDELAAAFPELEMDWSASGVVKMSKRRDSFTATFCLPYSSDLASSFSFLSRVNFRTIST